MNIDNSIKSVLAEVSAITNCAAKAVDAATEARSIALALYKISGDYHKEHLDRIIDLMNIIECEIGRI